MSTGNCGSFAASAGRNSSCELLREREKFDSIDGIFAYQPLLWPSVRPGAGRDCALPGGAATAGLLPASSGRRNANRSNGTARLDWAAPAAAAEAVGNDDLDAGGHGGAGHRSSEIRADVRSIPRAARFK